YSSTGSLGLLTTRAREQKSSKNVLPCGRHSWSRSSSPPVRSFALVSYDVSRVRLLWNEIVSFSTRSCCSIPQTTPRSPAASPHEVSSVVRSPSTFQPSHG